MKVLIADKFEKSGIDGLKWMESSAVAELIKNEHPQIIATILVHLDRDQHSTLSGALFDAVRPILTGR